MHSLAVCTRRGVEEGTNSPIQVTRTSWVYAKRQNLPLRACDKAEQGSSWEKDTVCQP